MSSEVMIENYFQLKKLTILREQACEEIKQLSLFFNDFRYQANMIINHIKKSLLKIKNLNKIIIEYNGNNYNQDICPLIMQIIHEQSNLTNLQISFYENPIQKDNVLNIYKILNSWHLKKDGAIEELLFENQAIFIWRCPKYNLYEDFEFEEIFDERFDILCQTSPLEKIIVELVIPQKELSEEYCEALIQSLKQWRFLKHFQLICKSIPKKYEDLITFQVRKIEDLESCLIVSELSGLLFKLGYISSFNNQKNVLLQIKQSTFELENQRFLFNYDALKYIFTKELNTYQIISAQKININFEKKNSQQKRLREYTVKNLMKFVSDLKSLQQLNLNLKNNNLTYLAGQPIGECIDSLKNLIEINLDLSDNRLGANGILNILQAFEKKVRKFNMISINLNRNLIQNEGFVHLINFLRDQSQKANILELGKYTRNGMDKQLFESKKEIKLEYLSLDLSNNRLQKDLLDQLLKVLSILVDLKSIELKLTGNIIEIQSEFNFSQLKELSTLSLTFWCNNFQDSSLTNIFKSMKSVKSLKELTFELINNNMHDNVQSFDGHLDHLNMLRKLSLVYSKNGSNFTQLRNFDITFLEIRHLEELTIEVSNCNFSQTGVFEITKSLGYLVNLLKIDLNFSENKDFTDECSTLIIDNIYLLPSVQILILNYQKTAITDNTVRCLFNKIVDMISLRSVTFDFSENNTSQNAWKYTVDGLIKANQIQYPQFRL